MVKRATQMALLLGAATHCSPDFTDSTAIVTTPRLLAVQATPAEAPPGSAFALRSLYVGPTGTADAGSLAWATCLLAKPLGDPDSVNPSCLTSAGAGLTVLAGGPDTHATVPANACELFGPESPPAAEGQPSARPTDPDATGGYYLPVRVLAGQGAPSVAFERIACQPSGVVESVFTAFSTEYVDNENPVVAGLSRVDDAGASVPIAAEAPGKKPGLVVAPGVLTSLRVDWPACPAMPAACAGAETYVLIDASTAGLTTSRESMVASWYASAGSFALDRVGRDGTDETTSVTNTWRAPTTAGLVHLWVVLRDARGGVGWESYAVQVGP